MESLEVDNNVVMTSDQMTAYIYLRGELPAPQGGNEIIWLNDQGVREFGGVITQIQETDIGADLEYQITAQSYEHWMDRRLVVNYYGQMNADQMVTQIINSFTTGFTTNNVQSSYAIPPYYANYVKVSDALKKIAEQVGFGWYCDYYKDIHFYPVESFVSPLPNNTLSPDTDTANYSDLVITSDSTQLKTRVYLKGFKSRVATPATLKYVCDGNATQWSLGYKPSRQTGDLTITVGSQAMTIKRDIVDGAPGQNTSDTTSAYVNYSQNMFRLNFAPVNGTIITVQMYYLQDTICMRENPAAQNLAAVTDGNGDGRYEYAHTEQSLTQATLDAANARGDQLLMKYAYPQITGTFNSFTQGWRAGQYFNLSSVRRMGGINQVFYVQQVKKKIVKADAHGLMIQYQITFGSTPYLTV